MNFLTTRSRYPNLPLAYTALAGTPGILIGTVFMAFHASQGVDWCMDDQPVWITTRTGRILSVPYSQELNDSSAIIGKQIDAVDYASMIISINSTKCGRRPIIGRWSEP